jgi:tetratricopeptide (TPR) repeat protein
MGALPESEVKKFLEKHMDDALGQSAAEALMETAAEALAAGQIDDAVECYGAALAQEPENLGAMAGLAHSHLAAGDMDMAQQVLAAAPLHDNDPALASARAALALAGKTAPSDLGDAAEFWRYWIKMRITIRRGLIWRWRITAAVDVRRRLTNYWKLSRVSAIGTKTQRANNCSNYLTHMARKMI